MRVSEVMTRAVQQVSASMSANDAWRLMQRKRFHHLVVTHDSDVVGVVSDRDIGGPNGGRIRARASVADLMTMNTVTIAPDERVSRAANLMRGRAIGCLPVVDDEHLVGIVTVSDLLELVGREIVPAHSSRERKPRRVAPRRARRRR